MILGHDIIESSATANQTAAFLVLLGEELYKFLRRSRINGPQSPDAYLIGAVSLSAFEGYWENGWTTFASTASSLRTLSQARARACRRSEIQS